MTSARQDPFGPQLAPASAEDQSGLRLRGEWTGEAGHRLDDDTEPANDFELLPSLYDAGFDGDDTIVAPELTPAEESLELDIELTPAEPSLELDIELAEPRPAAAVDPDPSIEVDLDGLAPERHALEAAVALRSESHLWEGFDGDLGVFVATYRELPIGSPVTLTLHLLGEPTLTLHATVRFLRDDPSQWRGLGLQLDQPTAYLREAFRRFGRRRPPAFFHG